MAANLNKNLNFNPLHPNHSASAFSRAQNKQDLSPHNPRLNPFFHKMVIVDRKHCSALNNYWISMKLGKLTQKTFIH